MIRKDDRPGDAAELRRRAEEMDRGKAAPSADAAGGAPVYRVVMSDITGRKRTEEALQKALDEIRTLRGIREMQEAPIDQPG